MRRTCDACALESSWLTLAVSGGLAALKIVVGIMAGSKALVASALYSLNDLLSALVAISAMRRAGRAAVAIAGVILAGGVVYVVVHSAAALAGGVTAPPHLIVFSVTGVCMAVNEYLARRNLCAAERTRSPLVRAVAEHHRADAISSLAVMVALGGSTIGVHALDPIIAILEAIHVVRLAAARLRIDHRSPSCG